MDIKQIGYEDVFSETSHYICKEKQENGIVFLHLQTQEEVFLTNEYIKDNLICAEQYDEEIKVGKEDKKDGTLGIRSIWENIPVNDVFTVVFTKKGKDFDKEEIVEEFSNALSKAKNQKKSVVSAGIKYLESVFDNIQGEERVLRGFKLESYNRSGYYAVFDMEKKDNKIRKNASVNINTISSIIYKNKKYTCV